MKLLDARISINGDVYYEDWSNIQQQVAPGCGYKYTTNAGKAKVYGAELEAAIVLVPGLVFSQSVGYTHATNSTTVAQAGVSSGDRLLDVPEVTANTALPLSISARRRPESDRTSQQQLRRFHPGHHVRAQHPAVLRSRRHACRVETDRWSAVLFVDNLTNKRALLSDTGALSANISILDRVATNQPRTVGADLSYKF